MSVVFKQFSDALLHVYSHNQNQDWQENGPMTYKREGLDRKQRLGLTPHVLSHVYTSYNAIYNIPSTNCKNKKNLEYAHIQRNPTNVIIEA